MITLIRKYKSQNNYGKAQLIIGFISLFFLLFSVLYIFAHSCMEYTDKNGNVVKPDPWFRCFAYFTIICSALSISYFIAWIVDFYKPLKCFKDDILLVLIVSYEILVFFGYFLSFVQNIIACNYEDATNLIKDQLTFEGLHNFLIHFVTPWLIFTFFLLQNYKKNSDFKKINYRKIYYGFIIPFLYSNYLIIIFFVTKVSQYGSLTAFWNFPEIKDNNLLVSNTITGSWLNLFYIVFLGFFLFTILNLNYFINKNHKNK
ncbi:MAG: hypothetical protein LBB95_00715 [Mycoplasmataceae bacterium]|nr:hypothetical protein [Mycoplasmataceae bacterium]